MIKMNKFGGYAAGVFTLLLASADLSAQTLKPGSLIQINNSNGDMSAMTENELLQCGGPIDSETIEYIGCGFNSVQGADGKCQVEANESFEIDYGLNNAASCTGTQGTADWQGSHPIGFGNGDFSYTISNGIEGETTFVLNCTPQSSRHNFKRLVRSDTIDLTRRIKSGVAMARDYDVMWMVDMNSQGIGTHKIQHAYDKGRVGDTEFIIFQADTNLALIPVNTDGNIGLDLPAREFKEEIATYLVISGEPPTAEKTPEFKARGICDAFSADNAAAIYLTFKPGGKGCYVDLRQPAYLSWYLFEKK